VTRLSEHRYAAVLVVFLSGDFNKDTVECGKQRTRASRNYIPTVIQTVTRISAHTISKTAEAAVTTTSKFL